MASRRRRGGSLRALGVLAGVLALAGPGAAARAAEPAAGAAASPPAEAAAADLTQLPFEQLLDLRISSASQFEQNLRDAPSAVVVLTAADIKNYGWRTLADALATLPGVYLNYDRNYAYLGARGFLRPGDYDSRFLLLIDGNRLNDSVYDEAAIGTEFVLDVDLIDRIEYVPGPGSAIYGPNAFFGVINVITKKGRDFDGMQAAGSVGTDAARQGRVTYGWRGSGGGDLLVSASLYDDPGRDRFYPEFDTPDQNHGVAHNLDYDRAQNYYAKASWSDFTLALAHSDRTKGIPTASFQQAFDDPRSKTNDKQSFADLSYAHWFSTDTELAGHLFWNRYDYNGHYIYGPPATVNHDGDAALWYGLNLHATTTALHNHKIVAGADFIRDAHRDQFNFDEQPYAQNLDAHHSESRYGVYLEDEVTILPQLLFNAGVRYDDDLVTGRHFNPRTALIWKASGSTTAKAIFGTAYRAPNAYELYYQTPPPGGQESNPRLRAEHINTSELVLQQGVFHGGLLSVSLFDYRVRGLITQTTDPANGQLVFENLAVVDAYGAEAAYEQRWDMGAKLRASYAWQISEAEQDDMHTRLQNSPKHLAKLNLSSPLWPRRLSGGAEVQYVSSRMGLSQVVGGYWIANLTLLAPLPLKNADVAFSVYNLFDRSYADPTGPEFTQNAIVQDGRSFRLKLELGI